MTPQQINIAMAEVEGWEERGGGPEGIYYTHPSLSIEKNYDVAGLSRDEYLLNELPNYLNDRNATWRVLETLNDPEKFRLSQIICSQCETVGIGRAYEILSMPLDKIIRAILEVKGKWVEV